MNRRGTTGNLNRGGRKKGARNKATVEIRDAARKLLEDPSYQRDLAKRLKAGRAPHMETLLHHYAYGKPVERIGGESDGPLEVVVRFVRAVTVNG